MTPLPQVPPADDSPALSECIATFQRHLHMPDPGAVLVVLAVVAANRAEGDPVWLLEVGPPGGGKTEVLDALSGLPDVHPAATLTEASLLSGTPAKDKASSAKGGLLREIGDYGIIVAKDFGSVLSMHREECGPCCSPRSVRSMTGAGLAMSDRMVAARCHGSARSVSSAVSRRRSTVTTRSWARSASGSCCSACRILTRKPKPVVALEHLGSERRMRVELAQAVHAVLDAADPVALTAPPAEDLVEELVRLSTLAVKCRSDVEHDGYSREILLIPQAEAPARLALVLLRLWNAFLAIGADEKTTRHLVTKCALDSMPQLRRQVIEQLIKRQRLSTPAIADLIGYPTSTTRRGCEDLTGHGVLEREPGGQGKPDVWSLAEWACDQWPTVPEMSEGSFGDVQSVPEMSEGLPKAQVNGSNPLSLSSPLPIAADNSGTLTARLQEFDFDDADLERMFAGDEGETS